VILLAVPLSRVNPRQGRYLKLLPSILVYLAYLALLLACKGAAEKGRLSAFASMGGVHGLFFCLGLFLLNWTRLSLWWEKRRSMAAVGAS
jgi:lipopolysaccharide export system permease protein